MAIQRIDIANSLTSLGIALGALTAFFDSVEFDNDSSPTKITCKDDSDNVIFEVEDNGGTWTYTAYKDENTSVASPASSQSVAGPLYLYTVGNTGAMIEAPNGFLIAIAKVTTGETGFAIPNAFGVAANKGDVNVACFLLDCVFQHIVDSIDDVLVVHIFCLTQTGEIFQIIVIFLRVVFGSRLYRLFEAEKIIDGFINFLRRSDNRNYFAAA